MWASITSARGTGSTVWAASTSTRERGDVDNHHPTADEVLSHLVHNGAAVVDALNVPLKGREIAYRSPRPRHGLPAGARLVVVARAALVFGRHRRMGRIRCEAGGR
jgi:hypothetical protein